MVIRKLDSKTSRYFSLIGQDNGLGSDPYIRKSSFLRAFSYVWCVETAWFVYNLQFNFELCVQCRYACYEALSPLQKVFLGTTLGKGNMHQNTKLTPVLRKEIYGKWRKSKGVLSLRVLAAEYHVDKRVISRIIERGRGGDFSVHSSTNHRYQKSRSR